MHSRASGRFTHSSRPFDGSDMQQQSDKRPAENLFHSLVTLCLDRFLTSARRRLLMNIWAASARPLLARFRFRPRAFSLNQTSSPPPSALQCRAHTCCTRLESARCCHDRLLRDSRVTHTTEKHRLDRRDRLRDLQCHPDHIHSLPSLIALHQFLR